MQKAKIIRIVLDGVFILVGTFIYAVGINMLIVPNHLTSGGLTGLATQLNYLFGIPAGVLVLAMNIPLLILGWVKLGGRFVFATAAATVMSSVFIDVVKLWIPAYHGDQLLVALFGGVITGLGSSLLYLRGVSMGGTAIVSTLINKRFSHLPLGTVSMALNSLVIISSAFVYGNVEGALCSAVGAFVSSKVIDTVLMGADSGNVFLAVTDKPQELADVIHAVSGRGATVLRASGGYAGEDRAVLLCVARRHQFSKVKRAIKAVDPRAFVVVSDTREVLGNGFKDLE